ncbi:hypothetical protein HWA77_10650 [Photobacterium damselae subsp. damselae]|uniref:ParB/Spo0J HTH domain-containing protein n=1 Tax=Photobacterium damselae subsp. damselae TaxID=85581 RepID=A0A850QVK8_PHODD|nr:hypothetical protein [Photobacterium damselae subsp. damselae]
MTDVIKSTGKSIGSAVLLLKKEGQISSADTPDGFAIQRAETYRIDFNLLYVEDGFNVRELDEEQVNSFCHSYTNGLFVPALDVEPVTVNDEIRFKVIDGHHRYAGAKKAISKGAEIKTLPVVEFSGNDSDKLFHMITSSQGRSLSMLERAYAYQRLINQGNSNKEIASRLGVPAATISNALTLLKADKQVLNHVKLGDISASRVVNLIREHATIDDAAKIMNAEINLKLANQNIANTEASNDEDQITIPGVSSEQQTTGVSAEAQQNDTETKPKGEKPQRSKQLKLKKLNPKLTGIITEEFSELVSTIQEALVSDSNSDLDEIAVNISRKKVFDLITLASEIDEVNKYNANIQQQIEELNSQQS